MVQPFTQTDGPRLRTVGQLIAQAREDAGLEQGELADRIGVSRTKMSRLENDHRSPRVDELDRIADETGAEWLRYGCHISSYVAPVEMPSGQMELFDAADPRVRAGELAVVSR